MNCLKCEKCNYSTTFKHCFERHLLSKRHLEERINEYHCEKCQYTTTFKHCFERHLQCSSHLEEKINEYKCEKCQYTTKNKQNFEIHLQSKKHTEEKQKFEPIFCKCCKIQLCTSKQHIEHKNSIKHKRNLRNYEPPIILIPPAPSPVPIPAPSPVPPAPIEPKKSIDLFKPFYATFAPNEKMFEIIIKLIKENKENQVFLPEGTEQIRLYARQIGDDFKVAVIPTKNKADYFKLGLLTREELREIKHNGLKYENDDDGFGGFHHILGYIRSDKIDS